MPSEKQPAQIGHLPAHEREQFRVVFWQVGNARFTLKIKVKTSKQNLHGYPPSVGTAHDSRKGKGGISHVASVFDRALRAGTRPASGV